VPLRHAHALTASCFGGAEASDGRCVARSPPQRPLTPYSLKTMPRKPISCIAGRRRSLVSIGCLVSTTQSILLLACACSIKCFLHVSQPLAFRRPKEPSDAPIKLHGGAVVGSVAHAGREATLATHDLPPDLWHRGHALPGGRAGDSRLLNHCRPNPVIQKLHRPLGHVDHQLHGHTGR
jgi:hypothetical protein